MTPPSISESTPELLALMREMASRRRPRDLVEQRARDAFVVPAFLDQRSVHQLDGLALGAAPAFEAVQLSPVAQLGVCSVLAPTSQDRTLSALRGTEVVSDPTNALALECAQRLKALPHSTVRLCTVHQVLRAQPLPPRAGHTRHFRLFALTTAGVGRAEDAFEVDAIASQLGVFDRLLDAAANTLGCVFGPRRAVVRTDDARATLGNRVCERLARELPHVEVERAPLDAAYYGGVRVMFGPHTQSGDWIAIGDCGVFDWVARLTANRRMRFVAAGFGLQLLRVLFTR
ncbi:MAG TPA: hypothetical protein VFG30_02420 [Polyangiales bacterium]|nr:hypothetical protein [Polyangiales bacterium]